jgi:hypothetical protein
MFISQKNSFLKNQIILGVSFLSLVMLLDFMLPVIKQVDASHGFNPLEFLKLNQLRMLVSILFALSMCLITNRYPNLKLSPVAAVIVGAIFGLYAGCKIAMHV